MNQDKAARLAAIRAANAAKAAGATPPEGAASGVVPGDALEELDTRPPAIPLPLLGALFAAVIIGAIAAVWMLPAWLPGLNTSLSGAEPKAYWYISRVSAFVAYALLWLAMVLGLLMTNRLARLWPGGPVAFDLHQYTSLLGLAFALFHALILLGDHYMNYRLVQVLIPFASWNYAPFWVGLGQVSLYLMAIVGLSFYVRRAVSRRTWKLIHGLSFAVFCLVLLHGLTSGSDTGTGWALSIYLFTGGSVLFLTLYRVLRSQLYAGTPSQRPVHPR